MTIDQSDSRTEMFVCRTGWTLHSKEQLMSQGFFSFSGVVINLENVKLAIVCTPNLYAKLIGLRT